MSRQRSPRIANAVHIVAHEPARNRSAVRVHASGISNSKVSWRDRRTRACDLESPDTVPNPIPKLFGNLPRTSPLSTEPENAFSIEGLVGSTNRSTRLRAMLRGVLRTCYGSLANDRAIEFWLRIALSCLFTVATFAQSDRGTITGTVSDPANAVIPGASVLATNTENGSQFETVTTATGNYTIAGMPAGMYNLTVTSDGFNRFIQQGLRIQVAMTARVDVILQVGSTTESITITADAPAAVPQDASPVSVRLRHRGSL